MKTNINAIVSRTFGKVANALWKHSPEILAVTGTVGVIIGGVMACQETLKVEEILEQHKERLDMVHKAMTDETLKETYSEADSKRDLAIIYTNTAVALAKNYAPSIIVEFLSLSGLLASNNILRKRNIALTAAYAAIDKGFKEYRKRIASAFGEEVERNLYHNLKVVDIVEDPQVDENGEVTEPKHTAITVCPQNSYSPYSKIFDEYNVNWVKDSSSNRYFLDRVQRMWNDTLVARMGRPVFLNEVYESLGFEPTKAGQIVGWVYDPSNPDIDNYISFGIYDIYTCSTDQAERRAAFVNGYERSVILDFNVDGNVWDLMK